MCKSLILKQVTEKDELMAVQKESKQEKEYGIMYVEEDE